MHSNILKESILHSAGLEKVQMRAVGMISGLQGKTYQEKLTELGLMSLAQRRTRFEMIMTFKNMHGFS